MGGINLNNIFRRNQHPSDTIISVLEGLRWQHRATGEGALCAVDNPWVEKGRVGMMISVKGSGAVITIVPEIPFRIEHLTLLKKFSAQYNISGSFLHSMVSPDSKLIFEREVSNLSRLRKILVESMNEASRAALVAAALIMS